MKVKPKVNSLHLSKVNCWTKVEFTTFGSESEAKTEIRSTSKQYSPTCPDDLPQFRVRVGLGTYLGWGYVSYIRDVTLIRTDSTEFCGFVDGFIRA